MEHIEEAVIEIPMKTKTKFEIDKKRGKIKLDRVLYSAMNYPAEYGYIDETLELDGDPLDILVVSSEATFPGCIVPAKIIGNLKLLDNGQEDNKIIAVCAVDPRYKEIKKLDDLSEFTLAEIKNFFENYKSLQGIIVEAKGFEGIEGALRTIAECRKRYQEKRQEIN